MKKLLVLALLTVGMTVFAQERKMKHDNLTIEERTELQVKKMTLNLNLTEKQQNEIKALLIQNAKEREAKKQELKERKEAGVKPTKEERLAIQNERLDAQIEMKKKMKAILNDEQMKKWEAQQEKREEKMKERTENHKNKKKRSE